MTTPSLARVRLVGREPERPERHRHDLDVGHGRRVSRGVGGGEGGIRARDGRPKPHFQCGAIEDQASAPAVRERGPQEPTHAWASGRRAGVAERAGFEPATGCPEPHFQCGAIVH